MLVGFWGVGWACVFYGVMWGEWSGEVLRIEY